jgi:hypothetical protein
MRPMLGLHILQLSDPMMIVDFLKTIYVGQIFYTLGITANKFVVLAFYWRLFSIKMRMTIWVVGGACAAWFIAIVGCSRVYYNTDTDSTLPRWAALSGTVFPFRQRGTLPLPTKRASRFATSTSVAPYPMSCLTSSSSSYRCPTYGGSMLHWDNDLSSPACSFWEHLSRSCHWSVSSSSSKFRSPPLEI